MPTINSVLGPIDVVDLGFTLTHEHLFTASAGIQRTYPELFGTFDDLTQHVVSSLTEAREGGVQTMIEVSTLDLGRDIQFLADMSRRTGVNIIAATGIWRDIPRSLWNRTPDEVAPAGSTTQMVGSTLRGNSFRDCCNWAPRRSR